MATEMPGAVAVSGANEIRRRAKEVNAVLFGPGMTDEGAAARLGRKVLPQIGKAVVVLDAAALSCLTETAQCLHDLDCRVILTPHAGEMATMLGLDKSAVVRDPLKTAREARNLRAFVALKGAERHIVVHGFPQTYYNHAGNVGPRHVRLGRHALRSHQRAGRAGRSTFAGRGLGRPRRRP